MKLDELCYGFFDDPPARLRNGRHGFFNGGLAQGFWSPSEKSEEEDQDYAQINIC